MSHSSLVRAALQRRAVRWPLILALSSLAFTACPPLALSDTRSAQTETTTDDGHDHAAEDLADVSVDQIERGTAANAERIFRETGRRPGAAARRSTAVSADPGASGEWSAVIGTEVVPVFEAVLPDGKVLMWDSVGDNATETYPNQTFTRALVWNPADDTYKRVDVDGHNIFCAGFTHLQNGNILVAGGN